MQIQIQQEQPQLAEQDNQILFKTLSSESYENYIKISDYINTQPSLSFNIFQHIDQNNAEIDGQCPDDRNYGQNIIENIIMSHQDFSKHLKKQLQQQQQYNPQCQISFRKQSYAMGGSVGKMGIQLGNQANEDINVNADVKNKNGMQSEQNVQNGQFTKIFIQKQLRRKWKKNTNIPKFLVRMFLKYFHQFISNSENSAIHNELAQHHKKMKRKLTERSSNNFIIRDILKLVVKNGDEGVTLANRKILARILRQKQHEEIVGNKYIKQNQMSYLIGAKVYGLRCRSKLLLQRVKIL